MSILINPNDGVRWLMACYDFTREKAEQIFKFIDAGGVYPLPDGARLSMHQDAEDDND